MKALLTAIGAAFVLGMPVWAGAQPYPTKPVRIIVPYPPGGPQDPLVRLIQGPLGEALGQQIVVENRAGATGLIGMTACARSDPDGHTLCTVTNDGMMILPRLRSDMPFDVNRDLVGITQLVHTIQILVTPPKSPFNDFRGMVAYAKANPGKLNMSSFGLGGGVHQLLEAINKAAGIKIAHVPYKGSGPAVQAAVAAEVDLAASTPQVVGPLIRAGKLKALAIRSEQRNAELPDIPTYREQGYDLGSGGWFALAAPGKTPKAIVERLNREVVRIIKSPGVREKITAAFGAPPIGSTPEEFAKMMRDEARHADEMVALLKAAGYKPQ